MAKVYGDFTTHHDQPDTTDTLNAPGHGIISLDYERHRDFKAPKLYIQEIMYFRVTQNEPQHRHKHVLRKQNPVSLCTLLHMQLQNSICTTCKLPATNNLTRHIVSIHRTPGTRACHWFPLGLPESTGIFYGTFSLYMGVFFIWVASQWENCYISHLMFGLYIFQDGKQELHGHLIAFMGNGVTAIIWWCFPCSPLHVHGILSAALPGQSFPRLSDQDSPAKTAL